MSALPRTTGARDLCSSKRHTRTLMQGPHYGISGIRARSPLALLLRSRGWDDDDSDHVGRSGRAGSVLGGVGRMLPPHRQRGPHVPRARRGRRILGCRERRRRGAERWLRTFERWRDFAVARRGGWGQRYDIEGCRAAASGRRVSSSSGRVSSASDLPTARRAARHGLLRIDRVPRRSVPALQRLPRVGMRNGRVLLRAVQRGRALQGDELLGDTMRQRRGR